jgi:hypothetical protein
MVLVLSTPAFTGKTCSNRLKLQYQHSGTSFAPPGVPRNSLFWWRTCGLRYKQLEKALATPDVDPKAVHMVALEVVEIANLIAIRRPADRDGRDWEQGAMGVQEAALKMADAA